MGKTVRIFLLLGLAYSITVSIGCGGGPPTDLAEAAEVVHYLTRPSVLRHSAFTAAFSDPLPSQFVSYIFSEMGASEWPGEGSFSGQQQRDPTHAFPEPVPPPGVVFVARRADPAAGRQLVVTFDDARGVVIVVGYEDPGGEPVLEREWPLPDVEPAPGMRDYHYEKRRKL